MHALQVVLDYLPRIADCVRLFPEHLQAHVFNALMQVVLDVARGGEPVGAYGGSHNTYDPASTTLMAPVRDGYDPLGTGR